MPASVAPATTFMVFDPATNSYVAKQLDTMSPMAGAQAVQPQASAEPAPSVRQNVLVLDPKSDFFRYLEKSKP